MISSPVAVVEMPHKNHPYMLDRVPVSDEEGAGPFLISSSQSLLWVERPFSGGFLRVAVRKIELGALFRDLLNEVAVEGVFRDWGNVIPWGEGALKDGLERLQFYGFEDFVLLHGSRVKPPTGVDSAIAEWMPESWGLLIPSDRLYIGTVFSFTGGYAAALLHNPSRSMVVFQ